MEFVIPVHSVSRPLRRAVESCIASAPQGLVRALIIAHEISAASIAPLLDGLPKDSYRVLEFSDGIPSSAGPANFGFANADAEYVAKLDSDDFFSGRFSTSALERLRKHRWDVEVYPLLGDSGQTILAPLPRLARRRNLRPERDRLFYRTGQRAIMSADLLNRAPVLFRPGFRTGEDFALSFWLWSSGASIFFDDFLPAYHVTDDATDRLTADTYSWRELLAPLFEMVTMPWACERPLAVRRAMVVKSLRVTIFSPLKRMNSLAQVTPDDREALKEIAARLRAFAPGSERYLSRSEANGLDLLGSDDNDVSLALVRRHLNDTTLRMTRIAKNPFLTFTPEGPSGRVVDYLLNRARTRIARISHRRSSRTILG